MSESKASPVFVNAQGMEIIRAARIAAQQHFGLRPELSLVVMALLIEGAKSPKLNERIREVVMNAFGLDQAAAVPEATTEPAVG